MDRQKKKNKNLIQPEKFALNSGTANAMYEASKPVDRNTLASFLYWCWVVFGLSALVVFAWAEPISAMFMDYLIAAGMSTTIVHYCLEPLVMALRAILMVEAFGYAYHRFFQHVGFFTRVSHVFRKNQRFHWLHHMVIYPIGTVYKRARKYIAAEKGIGWSWVLPGIIVAMLFFVHHGVNLASLTFVAVLGYYAQFVVSLAHARFHVGDHPWAKSRYFHWLEDIHVLHHWDQRVNFTIVHPLMDRLFGTYMAPERHREEIEISLNEDGLTVSDLINWRYLLIEATPVERAAFISHVRYNTRSLKKLRLIHALLRERLSSFPDDSMAELLQERTEQLFEEIEKPMS